MQSLNEISSTNQVLGGCMKNVIADYTNLDLGKLVGGGFQVTVISTSHHHSSLCEIGLVGAIP